MTRVRPHLNGEAEVDTPRPIAELVEEAAARLTGEQLRALAARVEATELAAAREATSVPKSVPMDLAADVAFSLDGTVRRLAALWGSDGVGIDPDILGSWLLPQLIRAGASETAVIAALERHLGWRPRTHEERLEEVARAMLSEGWTRAQVTAALKAVVPS